MSYVHIDAEDCNALETLAELCAELTKRGVVFRAFRKGHLWVVELTGGY
jgi:hypothetical protein